MSKIQVTLLVDDDLIMETSQQENLEDAIRQELSWLHDSGMAVESWSFLEQAKTLQSFYYTFGTSETMPYQRGWVQVIAEDRTKADELFRSKYPDHTPGYLNCAFVYDQKAFAPVLEQMRKSDWDTTCHDVITQKEQQKSLSQKIQSAQDKKAVAHTPHEPQQEPQR